MHNTCSFAKLALVAALSLCATACVKIPNQQKDIEICDGNGCITRPHDYTSFKPEATETPEQTAKIASLEKLAEQDPRAAYDLALRYFRGDGVPQDSYRSIQWMRNAGEKGNLNAQKALGRLYLTGLGEMGSDPGEAEKWLTIAASKGDKESGKLLREAVEARKSEQAEWKFNNRWRSVFYNSWYRGYNYYWGWGANNRWYPY